MDDIDRALLRALVRGGRSTWASLGEQVSLSAPSVHERVHKLEAEGAILGYSARVAPQTVEAGTAALIALRTQGNAKERARLEADLAQEPAVLELHEVAGDDCYLAKVRVHSPSELAVLLGRLRERHPGLTSRSSVVLRSVFERPLLWPPEDPPALH
ncbi:MAG TPA: Lrp/AsnC family transcriptional regulator [Candidatus Dormibacteraeota bacterium]|nr:Lrp/AsnC family transcriptional regulator [Candidatus Dormibacteraeota bacterium]